ncbi:universal stress protein [Peribacillus sp. SCS-155]|uniref:universal stress protein n=1 Tax=Peribacillus sedimenti TaxID=3115297 RepID=UPI003906914E
MLAHFKYILVAFDGSEGGKKAIEWGVKVKKTVPDASLTIVHVSNEKVEQKTVGNASGFGITNDAMLLDPTQIPSLLASEQSNAVLNQETHTVVKNSSSLAERTALAILRDNQVEGRFIILEGNPATCIPEYAAHEGADLIIIGNSGKSGLKKLFLGSTSSTVAKEAHCPVLIAK